VMVASSWTSSCWYRASEFAASVEARISPIRHVSAYLATGK
jgi:hypothetical protein